MQYVRIQAIGLAPEYITTVHFSVDLIGSFGVVFNGLLAGHGFLLAGHGFLLELLVAQAPLVLDGGTKSPK